jgi:pilus assembly protein Flp/PilA
MMTTNALKRFWRDESGATAVEYGLVAALVGITIIAATKTLGNNVKNTFNKTAQNIN